jgi:hypothetical protein
VSKNALARLQGAAIASFARIAPSIPVEKPEARSSSAPKCWIGSNIEITSFEVFPSGRLKRSSLRSGDVRLAAPCRSLAAHFRAFVRPCVGDACSSAPIRRDGRRKSG